MPHGKDINKTRLDDLDREILRQSLQEPFDKKIVCNFGCGESSLSIALLGLGHTVYSYDTRDLHSFFDMTKEQFSKQHFMQIDLEKIKKHNLPNTIDVAIAQRVLHYMKYKDAVSFLKRVSLQLTDGGYMYISLSGVDSQLGQQYDAKHVDISNRMGTIGQLDQSNFEITEPLCLYSIDDAKQLIESTEELQIKKIWKSQFGNIKIIAERVKC